MALIQIIFSLAQLYLLFKMWRNLELVASAEERRDELKKQIKDFGAMFAQASELVPPKKKRVSFDAAAEE